MERVPEAELMNADAQARAYAEADFSAPHDTFVELFVASWSPARGPLRGPILDLGCGPADVTVRLALRCPDAILHGVDGSAAMLRYGRARVQRAGLESRITLARALLPRDAPPATAYPVVVSNSLLHHLHHPDVLWSSIRRWAAPGAHVFVMDLRRPASAVEVERLVETYARDEPEILRRDFRASLCAAFTPAEVAAQLVHAGLAALRVASVGDHHLTVRGTCEGPGAGARARDTLPF